MYKTGEKPGKGTYYCTKCGQRVILDDHTDTNVLILHLGVSISNCPNELCNGLFAVTEEFTQ